MSSNNSKVRKIALSLALLLPNAINGITFSLPNPVYPLLAESRHLPPFVEALFFAIFPLPLLFVFYYMPPFEHNCGAKTTYMVHLLFFTLSSFFMAFIHYLRSPWLFSIWSLLFRLLNGFADAGIAYQYRTLGKRLLPSHFALMNELTVATFIFFSGIGPFMSAPISAKYGFHVTCFLVSALALATTLFVWCVLYKENCDPVISESSVPRRLLS